MSYLITGANGFIGSYIARLLLEQGHEVHALKRARSNMDLVKDIEDQIHWHIGDVLDVPSLEAALEGRSGVFHSAAIISFVPSMHQRMIEVNQRGTENVVNCALHAGLNKLVHVSSISAFGRVEIKGPINESCSWHDGKGNTKYALSKHLAEQEAWRGHYEGLPTVIVNPSTVLGYGDWNAGSCKIFKSIYEGLKFYTKGSTGWVDVRDVAECCVRLMQSDIRGERFILSADNWTFQRLFTTIAQEFGVAAPKVEAKAWMGAIAWRAEKVKSMLTGKAPLLTKETIAMANKGFDYQNDKVKAALQFEFRSIESSIRDACAAYGKKNVG